MKTYIIVHTIFDTKTPFTIEARDADEALQKVFDHMGSTEYKIIRED